MDDIEVLELSLEPRLFRFQTVDDFDVQLQNLLQKKYAGVAQGIMPEGYLEAPLAYDAIWAIALGKVP